MNFYHTFSAAITHKALALLEEIFCGLNLVSSVIELLVMSNPMGGVARVEVLRFAAWLWLSPDSPFIFRPLGAQSTEVEA